jgi:hypothetical protein
VEDDLTHLDDMLKERIARLKADRDKAKHPDVRGFVRNWRARQDSNL